MESDAALENTGLPPGRVVILVLLDLVVVTPKPNHYDSVWGKVLQYRPL